MPLTVESFEEQGSGNFSAQSESITKEKIYIVHGNFHEFASEIDEIDVEDVVYNWVAHNVPLFRYVVTDEEDYLITLNGIDIEDASIREGAFRVTLSYEPPDAGSGNNAPTDGPAAGEELSDHFTQISFNTTPTRIRITTPINTVEVQQNTSFTVDSITAAEAKVIGLTDEGIEGAEIYDRQFSFQITAYVPSSFLTYAYVRSIYYMSCTVNKTSFFGFAPGTVLFLGMSGAGSYGPELIPITFEFEVKQNYKFLTSGTSGPDEEDPIEYLVDADFPDSAVSFPGALGHSGWSITDYRYQKQPSAGKAWVITKPSHRIIHEVYFASEFANLGI